MFKQIFRSKLCQPGTPFPPQNGSRPEAARKWNESGNPRVRVRVQLKFEFASPGPSPSPPEIRTSPGPSPSPSFWSKTESD